MLIHVKHLVGRTKKDGRFTQYESSQIPSNWFLLSLG
jgi:hypothetical protein